eukprot:9493968-Karenia_brevis.AAC.1
MLLGKAPGHLVNGLTRDSRIGHLNSFRADRTMCCFAPALRKALANSQGCGCPRLRCIFRSSRLCDS